MTALKQKPKILIVDDKPQNLFALEKQLAQLNVEIIQTTSGFEALKLAMTCSIFSKEVVNWSGVTGLVK